MLMKKHFRDYTLYQIVRKKKKNKTVSVLLVADFKQVVLHSTSRYTDNFTREFSFHPEHQSKSMTNAVTFINTDLN